MKKPEPLKEMNGEAIEHIISLCKIHVGRIENNLYNKIYKTSMEMVYGKNIMEWIESKKEIK